MNYREKIVLYQFITHHSRRLLTTAYYHGTESISNLETKLWDLVLNSLTEISSFEVFKLAIKKWKPENCPCRLCKVHVRNVGFL